MVAVPAGIARQNAPLAVQPSGTLTKTTRALGEGSSCQAPLESVVATEN